MTNKRIRKWLSVIVAILLLLAIGGGVAYIGIGFRYSGGMGSMAEAQRLRPLVEAMPTPTTTFAVYPTTTFAVHDGNTVGIVFPDGEWVVGVAKSTHDMYARLTGGGTVVLKDSRGRVRCFFGHVCGGGNIGQEVPKIDSLDALDAHLAQQFVEQTWP